MRMTASELYRTWTHGRKSEGRVYTSRLAARHDWG